MFGKRKSKDDKLDLLEVVAIGIGGMVGGGIFAVLGLSVQLTHGAAPLAFLIAGLVALLTAYSYSKLSVAFPSSGGTVEFLNRAYGRGLFSGGMNILLWISYIVMLSLYSNAFGSYGSSFFQGAMQGIMKHVFITAVVILLTVLNVMGTGIVGRAEEWIVAIKLAILVSFVIVGALTVKLGALSPSNWGSVLPIVAGGMLIFLAYEGFELIANTAKNVKNAVKILPKAYFISVGFVILLYVLVAAVAIGNLPVNQIVASKDYALAAAARPIMGSFGFILIAIAAMLSTASAINATLYGSCKVSYMAAKEGELPRQLDYKVWKRPIEGLLITAVVTIVIANLFSLSSISLMGSAGFLLIFAAVNAANIISSAQTNSKVWLAGLGVLACLGAFVILIWQVALSSPEEILFLAAMIAISFLIELVYQKVRKSKGNTTR